MSTSSSIEKPELEVGSTVCGWEVVRKLGAGGFGAVYHVRKDDVDAALKTEFIDAKRSQSLCNEVYQLRVLQWSDYFCRLFFACRARVDDQTMNVMIMSLVGRPLSRLRRMTPKRKFTKSTASRLTNQTLMAIRDLHSSGILHRDIKGSNFAWKETTRTVILLDLGFCRRFLAYNPLTRKLSHRPERRHAGFLGTSKYCSVNAHDEYDQGRRDDLWAWLYMAAEFFIVSGACTRPINPYDNAFLLRTLSNRFKLLERKYGHLPWSDEDYSLLIRKSKQAIGASLFLKCPREMLPIYDHVKSLAFDSRPDYDFMLTKIQHMFLRLDVEESDPYDFEEGGKYFEQYYKNKQSKSEKELSTSSAEDRTRSEVDLDSAPQLEFMESVVKTPIENHSKTVDESEDEKAKVPKENRLTAGFNRVYQIIGCGKKK